MRVLLAHPGTQHAPSLARELDRRGLLGEFWTGLALGEGGLAARLARFARGWPLVGGLANRIVPGVDRRRVHATPGLELRALAQLKRGRDSHTVLHERNAAFQAAIPDTSLAACDGVIGFDTSAWLLAERARRSGRRLWLDRTIGHPAAFSALLEQARRDFPAWSGPVAPRPAAVAAAEAREHELAHRIVVGSGFARDTLVANGVDAGKIRVNPYGVDWARYASAPRTPRGNRPLRFLFVGSIQLRKGVPYLLEAWRRLAPTDAELWLAGTSAVDPSLLPTLPGLKWLGQVPHAEIPALLASVDVFVLPSLFEGFSRAVIEALAAGLPVIATPNTGAGEALADPALGRVISTASVDALEAALRHYLAQPPDPAAVRAAAAPLEATFSWSAYGDRWAALLQET